MTMTFDNKSIKRRCAFMICMILLAISSMVRSQGLTEVLTGESSSEASSAEDKVISVDHSRLSDKKIEKRLRQIYSELDELKKLDISVSNGVVTLKGEVESKAGAEKAVRFAKQIEDVVEVDNQLAVTHSVDKRLKQTLTKVRVLGEEVLSGLPLLLVSLAIFVLFWLLGNAFSKRRAWFRRISVNDFIADLLGKLVHLVFIILGIILALSLLDATALLGTILGAAGIFGLAIGFAVRDTVENFIASVLLSIRNPFEVNDFVDIEGWQGSVARLTSRATILISPDGNHVRIPNSTVFKSVITNYTRNPNRRFEFSVGIGADVELSRAQSLALQSLDQVPGVLAEPKPQAIIQELGNPVVQMTLFGWINQKEHDFLKVRSEAIKMLKQRFEENGIDTPAPRYRLDIIHEVEALPENKRKQPVRAHMLTDENQVKDTSVDRTVEMQIEKENVEEGGENLLEGSASDEI